MKIGHKFVEFIPEELEMGILYLSLEYGTAVHRCFCGCGEKVVTPLSPTDWNIVYDGESISLSPSVGNWSFECQSHYWIQNSRVIWSESWSNAMINEARRYDHRRKLENYNEEPIIQENKEGDERGVFSELLHWFFRKNK